jgi:ribonuclease BN (tRNA processing enzyme)
MRLRVLGSSGAEFPGKETPGFLVDGSLLLDAGTIGAVLSEDEQWAIREILLTHAHLDHIKGIPFLADNIILKGSGRQVRIRSIEPVLRTLKDNLLNGAIWPDFTAIPEPDNAVLVLENIDSLKEYVIDGYRVTAYEVNHSVAAVGYVVEGPDGKRLLYTGDTGPTESIWAACHRRTHAAIIEVSMPGSMEEMAIKTGHLTAGLLKAELGKMKVLPDRILVTHPKPQYVSAIMEELGEVGHGNIELLRDGEVYEI